MDVKLQERLIEEAEQRIRDDEVFVYDAQQEIAEYMCPFEVGERVISAAGHEEIIASIRYSVNDIRYDFKTYSLKKNGEPYTLSSYCCRVDKYKKADE